MKFVGFQATIFLFISNALLPHKSSAYYQKSYAKIVYEWGVLEFDYPSEKARYEAIEKGRLQPFNVAITDIDYHAPTKRYFVTTPHSKTGSPATLSVVSDKGLLKPFPSWPRYNGSVPSCQDLFSVQRIQIDKCGLLWTLDAGRYDIDGINTLPCQPKLLVYDLNDKDREILHYDFPTSVFTDRSFLNNIITESYQSNCSDSIAYISDMNDFGLIVFDYATKTSWRIVHPYFRSYPTESFVTVEGVTRNIAQDGIDGLALSPSTEANRKLYFHSFASVRESWVPLSVLKNQTLAQNEEIARSAYVLSPGQRAGQSTVEVMTEDGILIYPILTINAIACWNSKTPFTIENQHILERNDKDFQFITGLKLKNNTLFVFSSRLQNYLEGNANNTDIKYRIMMIDDIEAALENTPCCGVGPSVMGVGFPNRRFSERHQWNNGFYMPDFFHRRFF